MCINFYKKNNSTPYLLELKEKRQEKLKLKTSINLS